MCTQAVGIRGHLVLVVLGFCTQLMAAAAAVVVAVVAECCRGCGRKEAGEVAAGAAGRGGSAGLGRAAPAGGAMRVTAG